MTVPVRSPEQRIAALARANEIRLYRAAIKRQIKAGTLTFSGVLDANNPLMATMKVSELLMAVPRIGERKAAKILRLEQVSMSKTVGGLSVRQRARLVGLFASGTPSFLGDALRTVYVPAHWKQVAA